MEVGAVGVAAKALTTKLLFAKAPTIVTVGLDNGPLTSYFGQSSVTPPHLPSVDLPSGAVSLPNATSFQAPTSGAPSDVSGPFRFFENLHGLKPPVPSGLGMESGAISTPPVSSFPAPTTTVSPLPDGVVPTHTEFINIPKTTTVDVGIDSGALPTSALGQSLVPPPETASVDLPSGIMKIPSDTGLPAPMSSGAGQDSGPIPQFESLPPNEPWNIMELSKVFGDKIGSIPFYSPTPSAFPPPGTEVHLPVGEIVGPSPPVIPHMGHIMGPDAWGPVTQASSSSIAVLAAPIGRAYEICSEFGDAGDEIMNEAVECFNRLARFSKTMMA